MNILALNHNQYAVAAVAVTLCLAGFYTIIDAGLSTTESGGFDSAGSDVIITDMKFSSQVGTLMVTAFQIEWNRLYTARMKIILTRMVTD
ncbi:MAG: hypothetical protein Ct9H90mP23_2840 [Methanobacteriota archaeon]|nr:MAG: hypothetical protein Ct9H90mP23_2840 [Euryarchaeota archaeon]